MLQEIVPHIYTFSSLMAGRVYLITQGDSLTLIDASIPPSGRKILSQLNAAGHKPQDLKRILEGMTADSTLADGDVLEDVLDGLHCVSTPGHAPGHMAYWHRENRILFCGDAIFNIPFNMRLPYAFLTVDMAENIRSIGKLAKLEPEVILFGNGKPITQNAAQKLNAFAKKVGAI